METGFCCLFPGYIQHALSKKDAYNIFNFSHDTSVFQSWAYAKIPPANIYINNKINPRKIFPWMLLNCMESCLRECLGLYLLLVGQ